MHRAKHIAGWGGATFWMMTSVIVFLLSSGIVMFWLPAEELPNLSTAQEFLRRTSVIVHGLFSWLFCVMLGRGIWPHVRVMWHRYAHPIKWAWGMLSLALLGFLALSGLALLYGTLTLHEALSPWHFWIGILVPGFFLIHTWGRFITQTKP